MASVKLEILRGGPPHNHLLSPLTSYLALCGDHTSSTLNVPFEHAQLLERLRALAYGRDPNDAEFTRRRGVELVELGRLMGDMLGAVPGLVKDLADSSRHDGDLTHLRLVLSANELALMPFELAIAPSAFPGTGDALFLQSVTPVCVTREIRRAAGVPFRWPRRPKVLFVTASPAGTSPVPLEAHLLALRQAIDPWVHYFPHEDKGRDDHDETQGERKVGEHIDVLPDASVQAIAEASATGEYTHVHILAHGVPMTANDDRRFGLALHDRLEPQRLDPVDGARLAAALRAHLTDGHRALARPVLVTLATCDSANAGGVMAPGSSIAHDLHRAGIPLVVASQFPLSFEGSVQLVRLLYQPLLWGEDPRLVLHDVRCQLAARVRDRHDWASLVAYADLPANLEYQLREVTFDQSRRAIEATMSHLDAMLDDMSGNARGDLESWRARAQAPLERIEKVRGKLLYLRTRSPDQVADIAGLLASAEKRLTEFWRRMALHAGTDSRLLREYSHNAERCQQEAERHYEEAFAVQGYSWALVQAMALSAARTQTVDAESWQLAWLLSKREEQIYPKEDERKISAINNLVELCMLARLPAQNAEGTLTPALQEHVGEASVWVDKLLSLQLRDHGQVRSLRRQLVRYAETFGMPPSVQAEAERLRIFIDASTRSST